MTQTTTADIVLTNGVIYTADAQDRICQAMAIKGERIVFVGGNQAARSYLGPATREIDLDGRLVIPGMMDTHIHPPGLSLSELYEVQLAGAHSLEGYLAAVRDFIARRPDAKMVYGRGWSWGVFSGEELTRGPRKEYLDAVTTAIPVVLRAHDGHTLWVNSKALEVNGITRDTPTPGGGVIEKDPASGELWGTLKEWAMWLIALPEYTLPQYLDAMAAFQRKMHRFGITGILCMGSLTFQSIFGACAELQRTGNLQLRVRGAITVNAKDDLAPQFAAIGQLRSQYSTRDLKITAAKFFTDGVVEGGTSHLLAPYTLAVGRGPHYYGDFLWDTVKLEEAFYLANAAGLQIHVHSTGDASTRKVLDALASVHGRLPPGDRRNTITHLQLVDAADIPRFKELGVIASVQPYWHFKGPGWWANVDHQFLGARAEQEFPLASFFANGVVVTSSSDYPATIIPDPLLAVESGVTRNLARGSLHGVADITDADDERYLLNAGERADIRQMLRSFTINSAYALFLEQETGSLEAGKLADLAVLDRDLLTIDPLDIDKAAVVMTFFGGQLVYDRPSA